MPDHNNIPNCQLDYLAGNTPRIKRVLGQPRHIEDTLAYSTSEAVHNTILYLDDISNFLEALSQIFIETSNDEYELRADLATQMIAAAQSYLTFYNSASGKNFQHMKEVHVLNQENATVLEDINNVKKVFGNPWKGKS